MTEGEWQGLFLQLKDGVLTCPGCQAANLWEPGMTALNCWHCRKAIPVPPKLVFGHSGGKHYLLLAKDAKVLKRHVDPLAAEDQAGTVVGQVVQNPANPQVWGIRNLSPVPWAATLPDGNALEVPPQKAVPLRAGLRVNIGGMAAEIIA